MSVTIGEVEVVSSPGEVAPPDRTSSEPVPPPLDEVSLHQRLQALHEQALRTWSH